MNSELKFILGMYKPTSSMVDKLALTFASSAHKDQKRSDGKPYIIHPIRVANQFPRGLVGVRCVALLHDVLEDTNVTVDELQESFPIGIVDSVVVLTKKENESYFDFIMRISNGNDSIAKMIKIADLTDNIEDNGKDTKHLKDKYRLARYILENSDYERN